MRFFLLATVAVVLAALLASLLLGGDPAQHTDPAGAPRDTVDETDGATLAGRVASEGTSPPVAKSTPAAKRVTITGTVLHRDRTPAPNVEVVIRAPEESGRLEHRLTTDAEGRFEVQLPAVEQWYSAYVPNRSGTYACWPDKNARLLLREPSRDAIVVRVLGPDGRPVPRVEVSCGPSNLPFMDVVEVEGGVVTLDGDEGDVISATNPRDADGRALNLLPGGTSVSKERTYELRLRPARRIHGTVRDTEGAPIAGVGVCVDARVVPFSSTSTKTDAQGRFTALGVGGLEDHVRLDVSTPKGYLPVRDRWIPPSTSHVEVVLTRGRDVSIRVLDPDGDPANGVTVQVRSVWDRQRVGRSAWTDAQGRAVLPGLPPETTMDVTIGQKGVWPWLAFEALETGTAEHVLRLVKGVMLSGKIRGTDGKPVAWAHVHAYGADDETRGFTYRVQLEDDAEAFELGPLRPGRYQLGARVAAPYASPDAVEVVAPGEDGVLVAPGAVALEGRFLDEDVVRPDIRFFSPRGTEGHDRSVSGGTFRLEGLRDDPGTLYAFEEKTDRFWIRHEVRPSDGPFEVRLESGQRVAGRLEGHHSVTSPWTGLTLRRGRFRLHTTAKRDGTFVFHAVPPGTYTLEIRSNDRKRVVHEGIEAGRTDLRLPLPTEYVPR